MPKPRSKRPKKSVGKKIYIFCEGDNTEKFYIEELKRKLDLHDRSSVDVKVVDNNYTDPKGIVNCAISSLESTPVREQHKEDQYWAVYDRESISKHSHQVHLEAKTTANSNGIFVALSSVCIEFWHLLHDRFTQASYASHTDLLACSPLKDFYSKIGITGDYKSRKNAINIARILVSEDGYLSNAMRHAERLNQNYMKELEIEFNANQLDGKLSDFKCAFDYPNLEVIEKLNPYTDFHRLVKSIMDCTKPSNT